MPQTISNVICVSIHKKKCYDTHVTFEGYVIF